VYSTTQFGEVFGDKCVLVLGDSLGRRLTSTLAVVLNASDTENDLKEEDLDNRETLMAGGHKMYDHTPKNGKCLLFKWSPKIENVLHDLKR